MDILSSVLVALARLCHVWLLSPQKLYLPCPKHQHSSSLLAISQPLSGDTGNVWPFPCATLGPQGLSDAMPILFCLETLMPALATQMLPCQAWHNVF